MKCYCCGKDLEGERYRTIDIGHTMVPVQNRGIRFAHRLPKFFFCRTCFEREGRVKLERMLVQAMMHHFF